MDIHGVEIDSPTVGVLCDDDLCLIKTIGQPTNDNPTAGDSNSSPDDGKLDKRHIISLVIEVSFTAIFQY